LFVIPLADLSSPSLRSGKELDAGAVLILWTRDYGVIPITTSAKEENIKKAALALDFPKLSERDMKEIEEAGRKIHWRAQVSKSCVLTW
jgi:diketogulonate reductase-like aldo/keto reductase